jgi:hypothetical protein
MAHTMINLTSVTAKSLSKSCSHSSGTVNKPYHHMSTMFIIRARKILDVIVFISVLGTILLAPTTVRNVCIPTACSNSVKLCGLYSYDTEWGPVAGSCTLWFHQRRGDFLIIQATISFLRALLCQIIVCSFHFIWNESIHEHISSARN